VTVREGAGQEEIEAFNKALTANLAKVAECASTEEMYAKVNDAVLNAAMGTIAEKKRMHYPKPVSRLKDYTATDYPLRTWRARMKGAIKAIESKDVTKIKRATRRAEWPYKKMIQDLEVPKFEEIGSLMERKVQLQHHVGYVNKYLTKTAIKERRDARKIAYDKRNEWFDDVTGKGKGKFLKSVFKTARKNHALAWARRKDGTLAATPQELGECVKDKFESWFASVVPVEERWGSWDKMMRFDTSEMDDTKRSIARGVDMSFRDFVKECYDEPEVR
jgi:hypothetical protein